MNALLKTDSDLIKIDQDHGVIDLYVDSGTVINAKTKLKWECDLELHLRNSEVVGIPILSSDLNGDLELISHSISHPIQGTHHNLYLTFALVPQEYHMQDFKFDQRSHIVTIKLVSKTYWKLLCSKNIEGILPAPIKILDKIEVE